MPEFHPKLRDKKKLGKDGLFSKAVLSLFVPSSHLSHPVPLAPIFLPSAYCYASYRDDHVLRMFKNV